MCAARRSLPPKGGQLSSGGTSDFPLSRSRLPSRLPAPPPLNTGSPLTRSSLEGPQSILSGLEGMPRFSGGNSFSLAEERKITAHNYPVVFLLPRLLGRGPVDGPRRAEWVRSLSRCGFEMFQLKKIYVVTTDSTGPGATRYKTGWQPSLLASRLGL